MTSLEARLRREILESLTEQWQPAGRLLGSRTLTSHAYVNLLQDGEIEEDLIVSRQRSGRRCRMVVARRRPQPEA